jgi:hypothetical protein
MLGSITVSAALAAVLGATNSASKSVHIHLTGLSEAKTPDN